MVAEYYFNKPGEKSSLPYFKPICGEHDQARYKGNVVNF
jgi:hypothetical protein